MPTATHTKPWVPQSSSAPASCCMSCRRVLPKSTATGCWATTNASAGSPWPAPPWNNPRFASNPKSPPGPPPRPRHVSGAPIARPPPTFAVSHYRCLRRKWTFFAGAAQIGLPEYWIAHDPLRSQAQRRLSQAAARFAPATVPHRFCPPPPLATNSAPSSLPIGCVTVTPGYTPLMERRSIFYPATSPAVRLRLLFL